MAPCKKSLRLKSLQETIQLVDKVNNTYKSNFTWKSTSGKSRFGEKSYQIVPLEKFPDGDKSYL